jgi:excisionase family DNA binding protein
MSMTDLAYIARQLERINGDLRLLSFREAARTLGVRRSTDGVLRQAISRGELKTVKIGKRLKIRRGDLAAWIERRTQ